jgi:cytochrome c biogenesis protein CcmG, thiol:disulfide interchange protein DsbE
MADAPELAAETANENASTPSVEAIPNESENPESRAVLYWQIAIVGIVLLFLGFLAWQLLQTNRFEQRASGAAPPFTFTTFEGETISLDDLSGKGVVVNFWASWCDPCRDEAALLESAWQREKDNGIVFIGLDYLDQEPAAKAYLEEFGITYPNGPDKQSEAARRYGIKGVPETFFIDGEGNITETVIGPIVSEAQMQQYLNEIRPGG